MLDLYGADDRPSFRPDSVPGGSEPEEEDMNLFLHNLLHTSPAVIAGSSSVCRSATLDYRSMISSSSGAGFNFSDPGGVGKKRVEKSFSLAAVGDSDADANMMLTMRNGLGFHRNYVPGCLPPVQLPMDFNEGNVMANRSRGADKLSKNQEVVLQTAFGISNPKLSSQQLAISSMTNNSSSAISFGLE